MDQALFAEKLLELHILIYDLFKPKSLTYKSLNGHLSPPFGSIILLLSNDIRTS